MESEFKSGGPQAGVQERVSQPTRPVCPGDVRSTMTREDREAEGWTSGVSPCGLLAGEPGWSLEPRTKHVRRGGRPRAVSMHRPQGQGPGGVSPESRGPQAVCRWRGIMR